MTEVLPIDLTRVPRSRVSEVDFDNLKFGKVFSDHMFTADYTDGCWQNLAILPYGNLEISPAMSALHYGQAIFEGMKAQRDKNGDVLVFRPYSNLERLNISAHRLCMPTLPEEIFMGALHRLLELDANWVPENEGCSLYIRPFMFATDAYVGIRPSESYKFVIFTCPVGSYYTAPVKVRIETEFTRAAEGGFGFAKAAGNYAGALYPTRLAQEDGYDQLLWTDAREHKYFEESGTMNVMFVIGNTILTPATGSSILSGVTRNSALQIARDWGYNVEERKVSVAEIIAAIENGTFSEGFGLGTAAVVAPMSVISYEGQDYHIKIDDNGFGQKVKRHLARIKGGIEPDIHGWIYRVKAR